MKFNDSCNASCKASCNVWGVLRLFAVKHTSVVAVWDDVLTPFYLFNVNRKLNPKSEEVTG